MPHIQRRDLLLAALSTLATARSADVLAADGPLRIIVSFPPGGASDQLGRALGQKLTERHGYPVIVENRPGAGSQIAVAALKQAPADGLTLFLGDIGAFSLNQHLYPKLGYDTDRDLAPVALLAKAPLLLVVPASSPARSLADLIDLARKKPQGLSYASPGAGTGAHIAAELLRRKTGSPLVHIPYRGAAPALVDLAAGQVDFMFDPLVSSGPFLKSGKIRALAIAAPARSRYLPDVPTLQEAGVQGANFIAWWGLAALAKTPSPRVNQLNTDIAAAMSSEDLVKRFQEMGLELGTPSAEAFQTLIKADALAYADVIREAGIRLE